MTVASLWKSLDRGRCGRPVGVKELLAHHRPRSSQDSSGNDKKSNNTENNGKNNKDTMVTPWNYHQHRKVTTQLPRPILAVDLSIWICEALSSSAMAEHHANPALYLVYSRVVKLLSLGVNIVAVVEGQRRDDDDRRNNNSKGIRRRGGSGSPFWRACAACESLLQSVLGVRVVRAEADGEALCALLNARGIVDGVISRDGDCLLYGAKVVYTNFSIENLDKSQVMRYDADNLQVIIDDDTDLRAGLTENLGSKEQSQSTNRRSLSSSAGVAVTPRAACSNGGTSFRLTRQDLIAFAIISGSDLAGSGVDKVGCRKAIRFLHKCRADNPIREDGAAIEELRSWARIARFHSEKPLDYCGEVLQDEDEGGNRTTRCSCCNHSGNKRSHQKNGCDTCGTKPGEPCLKASPSGVFRRSLRTKAIAMAPIFDPDSIIAKYQNPNGNKVPLPLMRYTSSRLPMPSPRFDLAESSSLIVRGRILENNKEFLRLSVARLVTRLSLHGTPSDNTQQREFSPACQGIKRKSCRNGDSFFEVIWKVKSTISKSNDEGAMFEFESFEPQELFRRRYPEMVTTFEIKGPVMKKQGNSEQMRRKAFLESFFSQRIEKKPERTSSIPATRGKQIKARDVFFEKVRIGKAMGKKDNGAEKLQISLPKGIHVGKTITVRTRDGELDDCSTLASYDSITDPPLSSLVVKEARSATQKQRQSPSIANTRLSDERPVLPTDDQFSRLDKQEKIVCNRKADGQHVQSPHLKVSSTRQAQMTTSETDFEEYRRLLPSPKVLFLGEARPLPDGSLKRDKKDGSTERLKVLNHGIDSAASHRSRSSRILEMGTNEFEYQFQPNEQSSFNENVSQSERWRKIAPRLPLESHNSFDHHPSGLNKPQPYDDPRPLQIDIPISSPIPRHMAQAYKKGILKQPRHIQTQIYDAGFQNEMVLAKHDIYRSTPELNKARINYHWSPLSPKPALLSQKGRDCWPKSVAGPLPFNDIDARGEFLSAEVVPGRHLELELHNELLFCNTMGIMVNHQKGPEYSRFQGLNRPSQSYHQGDASSNFAISGQNCRQRQVKPIREAQAPKQFDDRVVVNDCIKIRHHDQHWDQILESRGEDIYNSLRHENDTVCRDGPVAYQNNPDAFRGAPKRTWRGPDYSQTPEHHFPEGNSHHRQRAIRPRYVEKRPQSVRFSHDVKRSPISYNKHEKQERRDTFRTVYESGMVLDSSVNFHHSGYSYVRAHSQETKTDNEFNVGSWNYFSPTRATESQLNMELEYQKARSTVLLSLNSSYVGGL